ncbi:MAG: spondin domain-containing protein [Phycisphaerales bacterium JB060]
MIRNTMSMLGLAALTAAPAVAQSVQVRVENLAPDGGFSFSPVWMGFHDGSFNMFDAGTQARDLDGIQQIAELADAGPMASRFGMEQTMGVGGVVASGVGAPPFEPGETASMMFDVGDASQNRFLSYASMVVPSNDLFFGNDNALEVFDAAGNFNGPFTINIYGRDVWDAGTEVNDILDGPAFIEGADATAGTAEFEDIALFFSRPGADDYLTSIVGQTTATGATITSPIAEGELLGRITVVPAPGVASVGLVAGMGIIGRRRR